MKKRFLTIFTRCNTCDRMFRSTSERHETCRTCRTDREMRQFFHWLDLRLATA